MTNSDHDQKFVPVLLKVLLNFKNY